MEVPNPIVPLHCLFLVLHGKIVVYREPNDYFSARDNEPMQGKTPARNSSPLSNRSLTAAPRGAAHSSSERFDSTLSAPFEVRPTPWLRR